MYFFTKFEEIFCVELITNSNLLNVSILVYITHRKCHIFVIFVVSIGMC